MFKNNGIKLDLPIAIAPGVTLLELLNDLGMTQKELSERMGRPQKVINEIIKGLSGITPETSIQLETVFNVPARFWNNLESNYRERLAREKVNEELKKEINFASEFPYNEMAKWQWVPKELDKIKQVSYLHSYFGVTSLQNIIEMNKLEPVMYRISSKRKYSLPAISAWLRKGVIDSQGIETLSFDSHKLRSFLFEIRNLVTADLDTFKSRIKEILNECGVAFVVTPNLTNTPINGASRWLDSDKALIQLSIRNKYCDIFWFSLFHEIGHLLMHGKKDININLSSDINKDKEEEADEFAKNILIPPSAYQEFIQRGRFDISDLKRFAKDINISVGVVIGRLQYDKHIPIEKMNFYKQKFQWIKP